jgi:hypothetical protein
MSFGIYCGTFAAEVDRGNQEIESFKRLFHENGFFNVNFSLFDD